MPTDEKLRKAFKVFNQIGSSDENALRFHLRNIVLGIYADKKGAELEELNREWEFVGIHDG